MPHDLFGDVVVRPPSARARRSSVLVVSVVVHVVVLTLLVAVSLAATGTLPLPITRLAFTAEQPVTRVDIPPPAVPRREAPPPPENQPVVSPDAAPVQAPTGIAPEIITLAPEPFASRSADLVRVLRDSEPAPTVAPAPPSPPAPQVPVRLSSGVTAPRKIVNVDPIYPAVARAARIEGVVILEAVIDVNGAVESARVLRSIPMLDQAALDAVREWHFTPTLLSGVPVPIVMTVTVNFILTK